MDAMPLSSVKAMPLSSANKTANDTASNETATFNQLLVGNLTEQQPQVVKDIDVVEGEELNKLLSFLQSGDLSSIEGGEELIAELLIAEPVQQLNIIVEFLAEHFNTDIPEHLISPGNDLLKVMTNILNFLSDKSDLSAGSNNAAVLRFAKVLTLAQPYMDSSAQQLPKLDQVIQTLQKVTVQIEKAIQPLPKEQTSVHLLRTQQALPFIKSALSSSEAAIQAVESKEQTDTSSNLPFQHMSKLEQYVLNVQAGPKGNVAGQQLVDSFEQLLSRAKFTNVNGVQKLLIRLNPENLGALKVELTQQDGVINARIIASSAQTKDLLDAQMNGLKQAFVNQQISVEKVEIALELNNEKAEDGDSNRGHLNEQQNQSDSEKTDDEKEDFQRYFEEVLTNAEREGVEIDSD